MTLTVGELCATLDLDADPFRKNLNRAMAHGEAQGDRMKRAGDRMSIGLTAPILLAFTQMTGSASDLNETVSQSEQIFGTATSRIGTFAQTAAAKFGQSERAARDAANTFGLFFINAGKSKDEAAGMSIELTKLASDMASFKNTKPEDAVEALGAALRGESEPIRRYGVMLDDATLKQRALNMGLIESATGVLPPAIRMQAAYAEILAQTTTIQGDFERTADGLANKQRILSAELENTSAQLGDKLIPFAIKGAGVASFMVDTFAALPPALQTAVVGFAALLAASGPLLSIGGRLSTAWGTLADRVAATASPSTATAFTAISRGAAAAGIAVGGLTAAYAMFKAAAQSQRDDVAAMFPEWEKALDLGNATYAELTQRIGNIGGEIDRVNGIIDGSSAPWDADMRQGLTEGKAELERLAAAAQTMKDRADQLSVELGISSTEALRMAQSESIMGEAVDDATGELDAQRAATQASIEELQNYSDALAAMFDPLFAAQDATLALKAAQDNATAAAKEHGAGSLEAAEANRELVRAAMENEQAMVNLATAVSSGQVPLADSIATLNRWVEQGYITRQAANEQIWAFTVLANKANEVPDDVGIDVQATGVAATLSQIEMVKTAIGSVRKYVPVGFIGPTLPGQQRTPGPVQQRASGGPFGPGWLLAGEDGPELMRVGLGGEVFDADTTRQMLNGGGSTVPSSVGATASGGGDGGVRAGHDIDVVVNYPRQESDKVGLERAVRKGLAAAGL